MAVTAFLLAASLLIPWAPPPRTQILATDFSEIYPRKYHESDKAREACQFALYWSVLMLLGM
jgi:hypothetical protein